jgi:hypothetical protein
VLLFSNIFIFYRRKIKRKNGQVIGEGARNEITSPMRKTERRVWILEYLPEEYF